MRGVAGRMAACAVAVVLLLPEWGSAQVTLTGRTDPELGPRLRALLASGAYSVPADTILARGDTVRGTLLVPGGTFYVEGHVEGDLVAVAANLFLRPRSSVAGDVVNAGGGLYRSALARVGGEVVDRPLARYSVERTAEGWRIVGDAERPRLLVLPGIAGFRPPSYDRVNGLSLRWGPAVQLALGGRDTLRVAGWGSYFSDRGDLGGGAELTAGRRAVRLRVGAERDWRTNEEWIRGEPINSLTYFFLGKDYRNYYAADRAWALVERRWGRRVLVTARAGAQVEDASSLTPGTPWSVLAPDSVRNNPAIDDGRVSSGVAGVELEWVGREAALETQLDLEGAGGWLDGDHEFARFRFSGEWAMAALANHFLELEWTTMGPLPGTASLPRQRHSFVGGSNTLNTFDLAEFRGDRIMFVETKYVIPMNRYRVRLLGVPELQLIHATGMAWTATESGDLLQEIGLRLQFPFVYVRLMVNPEEGEPDFDAGLSWPFGRRRAWERPR